MTNPVTGEAARRLLARSNGRLIRGCQRTGRREIVVSVKEDDGGEALTLTLHLDATAAFGAAVGLSGPSISPSP